MQVIQLLTHIWFPRCEYLNIGKPTQNQFFPFSPMSSKEFQVTRWFNDWSFFAWLCLEKDRICSERILNFLSKLKSLLFTFFIRVFFFIFYVWTKKSSSLFLFVQLTIKLVSSNIRKKVSKSSIRIQMATSIRYRQSYSP